MSKYTEEQLDKAFDQWLEIARGNHAPGTDEWAAFVAEVEQELDYGGYAMAYELAELLLADADAPDDPDELAELHWEAAHFFGEHWPEVCA